MSHRHGVSTFLRQIEAAILQDDSRRVPLNRPLAIVNPVAIIIRSFLRSRTSPVHRRDHVLPGNRTIFSIKRFKPSFHKRVDLVAGIRDRPMEFSGESHVCKSTCELFSPINNVDRDSRLYPAQTKERGNPACLSIFFAKWFIVYEDRAVQFEDNTWVSPRKKIEKKREEEKRTAREPEAARDLSINSYTEKLVSKEITEREAASAKLVLGVCDERKSTTFVELDPDNRRTRSPHEIPFLLVLTIEKTTRNGRANVAGPVSRCLSVARYFVSPRLTSSNRETLPTRRRFSSRCRNSSVTSSLETAPNTTYLSSVTPRFLSINGAEPPSFSLTLRATRSLRLSFETLRSLHLVAPIDQSHGTQK